MIPFSPKGARTPPLLVGYWIGLFCSAVLAALLLWTSIRILGLNAKRDVLGVMILASVVATSAVVALDLLIVEQYEHPWPSEISEIRTRLHFGMLFLVGNTLMSFFYGLAIRNRLIEMGKQ